MQQRYWIDGKFESNDYRAKLAQLSARLRGQYGQGAAVLAYVKVGDSREQAQHTLQLFWQSQTAALQQSLQLALNAHQ
jgi:hypothetical protein